MTEFIYVVFPCNVRIFNTIFFIMTDINYTPAALCCEATAEKTKINWCCPSTSKTSQPDLAILVIKHERIRY